MRRSLAILSLLSLVAVAASAQPSSLPAEAQAYLDDWTTYSDETGEAQVVVRISEVNGVVQGRIIRVLPTQEHPTPQFQCDDCAGQYQGADLRTIPLITGMEWKGDHFAGGRITDPEKDKRYKATMKLDGPDRLRVRGYIGIRALGRTQVWRRAN
ncbi:MAG: DUF2147 domain-containing protein [Rubricoccaceae bacterium]